MNSHNAFIVAPKLKPFTRKMGVPEGASDNNREKFLPFNANPRLLVEKKEGEAASALGTISHFKEEGTPVPLGEKNFPHGNIPLELLV